MIDPERSSKMSTTILTQDDGNAGPVSLSPSAVRMHKICQGLAIGVGFSIPLSTSLAEIMIGLYVAAWCVEGRFREKWREMSRNPVALLAVGLFALLAVATLWSTAGMRDAVKCLGKYRELLYVPLFLSSFREAIVRRRALLAYMGGVTLLMGLSCFEWLSGVDIDLNSGTDFVVFKDRIVHNLLLSHLIYLLAIEFAERPKWRWLCATIIAVTLADMLFLVQGRTGYLVLVGLIPLFLMQRFGKKGLAYAAALFLISCPVLYFGSSKVRSRADVTVTQVLNEFGGPTRQRSSDPRMELYTNSLRIISRHPWLGTGTGSFVKEYTRDSDISIIGAAIDPHCEYLCLAVQTGIVGAGLFVLLLAWQWRLTGRLDPETQELGQGCVVTIALGSVVNSLILGFTGGLMLGYFGGLVFSPLTSGLIASNDKSSAPEIDMPLSDSQVPLRIRQAKVA